MAGDILSARINAIAGVSRNRVVRRKHCTGTITFRIPGCSVSTGKLAYVAPSWLSAVAGAPVVLEEKYVIFVKAFSNGNCYEFSASGTSKYCALGGAGFRIGFKLDSLQGQNMETFNTVLMSD